MFFASWLSVHSGTTVYCTGTVMGLPTFSHVTFGRLFKFYVPVSSSMNEDSGHVLGMMRVILKHLSNGMTGPLWALLSL